MAQDKDHSPSTAFSLQLSSGETPASPCQAVNSYEIICELTKSAEYLARLSCEPSDVGIVNVCSGSPRSMRGIVETWLAENNWRIDLNLGRYPYPDYEPFAFWGNAKKLHAICRLP